MTKAEGREVTYVAHEMAVTRQLDGVSCGAFAVLNAYRAFNGLNPQFRYDKVSL